jgi:hypothetical protein
MCAGVSLIMLTFGTLSGAVHADEAGVSYWLPGRFGSLAAAPTVPGWSMAEVYYHTTVAASGAVAAAKEIQIGRIPAAVNVSLNLNLNAQADLVLLNPTYTFATPVLGGQLAIRRHQPVRAVGVGHGAIDGGGGYTYFNPATGHEFSAVAGFTYNFKNHDTNYQNGIDFHRLGCFAVSVETGVWRSGRIWIPANHG